MPAPPAQVDATLIFNRDGKTFGAQTGCNSLSGDYHIAAGRMHVSNTGWSQAGCEPTWRMDQDEMLRDMYNASPTVYVDNQGIVLSGAGVELTLRAKDELCPDPCDDIAAEP